MEKSNYIFYSGGAKGADTLWYNLLTRAGYKVEKLTPQTLDECSYDELSWIEDAYLEVCSKLCRKELPIESYAGKLVRRDMLQVKDASQVIAVSTINPYTKLVNGGTGYSTTRGIILGIPVYLYDQDDESWKIWSNELNQFIFLEGTPKIVNKSCLVGSRELTDAGRIAIKTLVNNFIKYGND